MFLNTVASVNVYVLNDTNLGLIRSAAQARAKAKSQSVAKS